VNGPGHAARRRGQRTVLDVPSAHEYYLDVMRAEGASFNERMYARVTSHFQREREPADLLLVAATETATEADMERLAQRLAEVLS